MQLWSEEQNHRCSVLTPSTLHLTSSHSSVNYAPGPNGLLPNPPALSVLQNHVNETDIKMFMFAVITIATTLSEGQENPNVMVNYFNTIINGYGYPSIIVPQSILDSSKTISENKTLSSDVVLPTKDPLFNTSFGVHTLW